MNHQRIMQAEAKVIIGLLRERNVRLNITGGYVTPGYYVYNLRMDPIQKLKSLMETAEDMQRLVYAFRADNRIIDINDEEQQVFVRITDQPLNIEINRPKIGMLTYDSVRQRSEKLRREYVAIGGVSYATKDGQAIAWDMTNPSEPHCLVSGGTGSGKSALLVTLVASLAENTSPAKLQLAIVDGGNSTLKPLAKLPHAGVYASSVEDVLSLLDATAREVLWRKENEISLDNGNVDYRILIVIDELANLRAVMDKNEEAALEKAITVITAEGRKYGVHAITCTQKPLAAVIGSLAKTNASKRFVGSVPSKTDAVTCAGIADTGAEQLAGKGDFITVRGGKVRRFQAAYITEPDAVVGRICRQWNGVPMPSTKGGTEVVRGGTRTAGVPASTSGTSTYWQVEAHVSTRVENNVGESSTYRYVTLPDREPTAREQAYLRELYDRLGSKNAALKAAYGGVVNEDGKTPKTKRWLDDALDSSDDNSDKKIIRLQRSAA